MLCPKPRPRRKTPIRRVPAEEAEFVLRRDPECIIAMLVRHGYMARKPCSDRDSIEHVKPSLGMSVRRLHAREAMVKACLGHNLDGETSKARPCIRSYLSTLYPQWWAKYLPDPTPPGYCTGGSTV